MKRVFREVDGFRYAIHKEFTSSEDVKEFLEEVCCRQKVHEDALTVVKIVSEGPVRRAHDKNVRYGQPVRTRGKNIQVGEGMSSTHVVRC